MVTDRCSVAGCKNNAYNTKGKVPKVSYHQIPLNDIERRQVWASFCARKGKDGSEWIPGKRSVICSEHFIGNTYVNHPKSPSYAPTIHPIKGLSRKVPKGSAGRFKRWLERNQKKAIQNGTAGVVTPNEGPEPKNKNKISEPKKDSSSSDREITIDDSTTLEESNFDLSFPSSSLSSSISSKSQPQVVLVSNGNTITVKKRRIQSFKATSDFILPTNNKDVEMVECKPEISFMSSFISNNNNNNNNENEPNTSTFSSSDDQAKKAHETGKTSQQVNKNIIMIKCKSMNSIPLVSSSSSNLPIDNNKLKADKTRQRSKNIIMIPESSFSSTLSNDNDNGLTNRKIVSSVTNKLQTKESTLSSSTLASVSSDKSEISKVNHQLSNDLIMIDKPKSKESNFPTQSTLSFDSPFDDSENFNDTPKPKQISQVSSSSNNVVNNEISTYSLLSSNWNVLSSSNDFIGDSSENIIPECKLEPPCNNNNNVEYFVSYSDTPLLVPTIDYSRRNRFVINQSDLAEMTQQNNNNNRKPEVTRTTHEVATQTPDNRITGGPLKLFLSCISLEGAQCQVDHEVDSMSLWPKIQAKTVKFTVYDKERKVKPVFD